MAAKAESQEEQMVQEGARLWELSRDCRMTVPDSKMVFLLEEYMVNEEDLGIF